MHPPKEMSRKQSDEADRVWGVLFQFEAEEKDSLDRVEGLGHGYDELTIEVESEDGGRCSAVMYIANQSHIDDSIRPYSWYKRFVTEGANQNDLSKDYLTFLTSFPSKEDLDKARDTSNR